MKEVHRGVKGRMPWYWRMGLLHVILNENGNQYLWKVVNSFFHEYKKSADEYLSRDYLGSLPCFLSDPNKLLTNQSWPPSRRKYARKYYGTAVATC